MPYVGDDRRVPRPRMLARLWSDDEERPRDSLPYCARVTLSHVTIPKRNQTRRASRRSIGSALRPRGRADRTRTEAPPRGHRGLPRPKPAVAQEARVPRRGEGRHLPLTDEPLPGTKLRGHGPPQWLARLSDHIPDPGQHRTLFYGEYSNRVRGCGEPAEPAAEAGEEHKPRRRASPSWGRLIAKVYQVDPLVCTRCGKRMSVVAFVTDSAAIGRILDLG